MKKLVVYANGSKFVYEELYKKYLCDTQDGILSITMRDEYTGEEYLSARFKHWDYFLIEEE